MVRWILQALAVELLKILSEIFILHQPIALRSHAMEIGSSCVNLNLEALLIREMNL
jgi:hypothetical protein